MLETKLKLYAELLAKSYSQLTDNEVDLMYLLSKDEEVQKYLTSNTPD